MPPISIIDAFTAEAFGGNPAAVCILDSPAEPVWMQRVAAEMNLSETAFLLPDAGGPWGLRWFTPTVEVDLCGHATLASAHALWSGGRAEANAPIEFQTRSGLLSARKVGEWIELDFPIDPVSPAAPPVGLLEALGVGDALYTGRGRFDWFIELADEAAVAAVAPDFKALAGLGGRGVIVTSRSEVPEFDFVSRFFAPAAGVDEDPVTGSAHCALAEYWSKRLGSGALRARQISRRGGDLIVRCAGERVMIQGRAVSVMVGALQV